MNKAIQYPRKMIKHKELKNPPKFEPEKWRNYLEAGCYPYALNLKVDDFFLVGDLIDLRCTTYVSDEELISILKCELREIFGYEIYEAEKDTNLKEGEKLIYLQREEQTGSYHLLRKDEDGKWSHKYPRELPTQKDSAGMVIEDPECMVDRPFHGWYFLLRKGD